MRSIVFNGVDFGCLTRAKVMEESPLTVEPATACVPGRAGAAILDASIPPKVVKVKLFLEPMAKLSPTALDELRRRLHAALLVREGAELRYGERFAYRDALCTDAGAWDALFCAGSCTLTFTIFDPIAYSCDKRTETSSAFTVGGTWETLPDVSVVTHACDQVKVVSLDGRGSITVDGAFAAGDVLTLDFVSETACLNGADISNAIDIHSDFFSLAPGACKLAFVGASSHEVSFFERWV